MIEQTGSTMIPANASNFWAVYFCAFCMLLACSRADTYVAGKLKNFRVGPPLVHASFFLRRLGTLRREFKEDYRRAEVAHAVGMVDERRWCDPTWQPPSFVSQPPLTIQNNCFVFLIDHLYPGSLSALIVPSLPDINLCPCVLVFSLNLTHHNAHSQTHK